jgi:hypothetical protein
MKSIFMLAGVLILANAQAGELYRSVDSSGKVHYSDRPLPGADDVTAIKAYKAPEPDENLSYETRRAMQSFPVTLYSYPDCGAICQQARDLLSKRGIPFTEKSLLTQPEIDAFSKASGDKAIPKLTVGKAWLKGFLAEQWHRELDIAGYPKSAPLYRPRPVTPPVVQPAQPEQPGPSEQLPPPEPAEQLEQ